MTQSFDDTALRNISDIIADILTHGKITDQLASAGISQAGGSNKPDRVFYALKERQKQDGCGNNVLSFILQIINPKRYNDEAAFEKDRGRINEKLLYEGIEITVRGEPRQVDKAKTIQEAKERSIKIKQKVHGIFIHRDIIPFCEEEWLKDNYFHAILEINICQSQLLLRLNHEVSRSIASLLNRMAHSARYVWLGHSSKNGKTVIILSNDKNLSVDLPCEKIYSSPITGSSPKISISTAGSNVIGESDRYIYETH